MRRIAFVPIICAAAVLGCQEDDITFVPNPNSYQLIQPQDVSVGQDSTISLKDFGLVVVKNGTDTVPGPNTSDQPIPRLSYFIDNTNIAITNQFGIVRGLSGGTTTFRVKGYDTEVSFPVTVRSRPPTEVIFRVLSGPAGGLLPVANRTDTGTFYALPAERQSARLEAVIKTSPTDTAYCNYCGVKTTAQGGPRIMREVSFRSLDPTKATVNNAANPFAQRTSQTGGLVNTDTAGWVTAIDTTSTPVGIVMEIPGDNMSDTVWLKFALRPIDTLRIRPDSNDFPPSDIDDIGTERRVYPNSDTTAGNMTQSSNVNFIAGVDFLFRVQRLPIAPSTTPVTPVFLPVRQTGNVTVLRPVLPIVQWQSALDGYLSISPVGNHLGAVIGRCAFISTTCGAPSSQTARNALVINCNDNNGNKLPGVATLPQILFNGDGQYTIPGCVPTKNIPMPGAFCTTATSTDLSSVCTVWIRATAIDQATGKVLRDNYRINIRR